MRYFLLQFSAGTPMPRKPLPLATSNQNDDLGNNANVCFYMT